jgi:hypothetical protein
MTGPAYRTLQRRHHKLAKSNQKHFRRAKARRMKAPLAAGRETVTQESAT